MRVKGIARKKSADVSEEDLFEWLAVTDILFQTRGRFAAHDEHEKTSLVNAKAQVEEWSGRDAYVQS